MIFSKKETDERKKNNRIFSIKEFLDKIGFGFGSQQYVNILFFLVGAAPWLIFLINSIKVVLSIIFSSIVKEVSKFREISKNIISLGGILYGFSFLGIAFATMIKSVGLFIISLFIGLIAVVAYGDSYSKLLNSLMKKEKRGYFLKNLAKLGLLVSGVGILISGFLMDYFSIFGKKVEFVLLGNSFSFTVYGYVLAFEITAISFILSGYVLSFLKESYNVHKDVNIRDVIFNHFKKIFSNLKLFISAKLPFMLLLAGSISAFAQTLANTFYGLHIYQTFGNSFFNVAIIFLIALLGAPVGIMLTRGLLKSVGVFPLLILGVLLLAITPFAYYLSLSLVIITIATFLGILGGSMVGISHNILTNKIVYESEREQFYETNSVLMIIPYVILIPVALIVLVNGFKLAFLFSAGLLACFVAPMYFLTLLTYSKYNQ